MSNAYGYITWWGFSPARNLLEELSKHRGGDGEKSEYNILLVGAGDGRHILKTICKLRGSLKKINFYVIENSLETLARQLLLVTLALEPSSEMSLQEKSELFLEIFGNSLIRPQAQDYIREQSTEFINWVTDCTEVKCPIWNFSNLKFKERDGLEELFKFWRNKDTTAFNIGHHWDERLRDHLGVRYDSKHGAFDWDYSMKLKERTTVINWTEYKHWREYGVAFQIRDESSYEISNKTLSSGIILNKKGERIAKLGYWGDIISSPYIAYGIECHEKSFFETQNKVHMKTSSDISLFNVISAMYELQTGQVYKADEEKCSIEVLNGDDGNEIELPDIMVHLLPLNCVHDMHRKSKYRSKFDLIFFSNSMVHHVDDTIHPLFCKDGLLMIESTRFMIDLKDELHKQYGEKITGMATNAGCKEAKKFEPKTDSFAYFKYDNH